MGVRAAHRGEETRADDKATSEQRTAAMCPAMHTVQARRRAARAPTEAAPRQSGRLAWMLSYLLAPVRFLALAWALDATSARSPAPPGSIPLAF